MKFKKRYLTLLVLAFLALYNVYPFNDFCYNVLNTFLFLVFSILFALVFLIITFYNLYKISLKEEFFDFVPGVLCLFFSSLVFLSINYSDTYFHKSRVKSFKSLSKNDLVSYKIILFDDMTFESKTVLEKSECTQKGSYYFKNDSLYLEKNNKTQKNSFFDSIYKYNKKSGFLTPISTGLETFKIYK